MAELLFLFNLTLWQKRIVHFKTYGTLGLAYAKTPLGVSPFIISKHSMIKCDHCTHSQRTFSLNFPLGILQFP